MISILLPSFAGGGAERVSLDLAKEFEGAGHEVEFAVMRADGSFLEEACSKFSVVDLEAPRARSLLFALVRYLRGARPASLLCTMWPLTFIGPIAARIAGIGCRVVIAEHGMLSVQYGDWGRSHNLALRLTTGLGYRLADHRVGVSAGLVADMSSLSYYNLRRFSVVHNPVRLRRSTTVSQLDHANELWRGKAGARILTVGKMKPVKNHPLLLRAFSRLANEDSRLMFVGDGDGLETLQSLARELGVEKQVIFAGFQADPTCFYLSADLFVLSSNSEGFGNVIVEALGCGTPVVSTDCPSGPREILDNGKYGRLVPVGDVEALAEGIKQGLLEQSRENLVARAQEFAPEIAAKKYLKLLIP